MSKGIIYGNGLYPSTRYQGSKRKLIEWIYENTRDLTFESVLDLFGGTGVTSYLFKKMGSEVTYNDYLMSNYYVGKALIENGTHFLSEDDLRFLLATTADKEFTFVSDTFEGMYYTNEENKWIDGTILNINRFDEKYSNPVLDYKKSLAYYCLFQSCLAKRPFNMFHRKNLYLRMADVKRSFGNKTTWDTPFELLFRKYAREINQLIFTNGKQNRAINTNAYEVNGREYDLVYIDPPYFSSNKSSVESDYRRMYHFLEGLARYNDWRNLIDYESFTLHLNDQKCKVLKKDNISLELENLIRTYAESIIVMSHKSAGIPSEEEIIDMMSKYKKNIVVKRKTYSYALSKSNNLKDRNEELLIIGK